MKEIILGNYDKLVFGKEFIRLDFYANSENKTITELVFYVSPKSYRSLLFRGLSKRAKRRKRGRLRSESKS